MSISLLLLLISLLIIIVSLPFIILCIILFLISHKNDFDFLISGLYSISQIKYQYSSFSLCFSIKIGNIRLRSYWIGIRIFIEDIEIKIHLKNSSEANMTYIYQSSKISEKDLIKLKQIFMELLINNFTTNSNFGNKLIKLNKKITDLSDLKISVQYSSIKEYILTYILKRIEIQIKNMNIFFKIKNNTYFNKVTVEKIVTGFISSNKENSEEHLCLIINGLNLYEENVIQKNILKKNNYCNNLLLNMNEIILLIKISGEFKNDESKILNYISIILEANKININLSALCIQRLFLTSEEIILFIKEYKNNEIINNQFIINKIYENSDTQSIIETYAELPIQTVEQFLINKINNSIKRLEIKFNNIQSNIYSDDFIYTEMILNINYVSIKSKNVQYPLKENADKYILIKNNTEIKLIQTKLYDFNNTKNNLIVEVPSYLINSKSFLSYSSKNKKAFYQSTVSSQLNFAQILINFNNLNKIIKLVDVILDGIDLIEYHLKNNFNQSFNFYKDYIVEKKYEFTFKNISFILYNKYLAIFGSNVIFKLNKIKISNESDDLILDFDPINLSYTTLDDNNDKITNYYTGHVLINKFKLTMQNIKLDKRIYLLKFYDIFIIAHDYHLFYIMKFISDILKCIFEDVVDKDYNKKKKFLSPITKRKSTVSLYMEKVELINYYNKEDVLHALINNFEIISNDHLSIPHAIVYHSFTKKYNFVHFVDLDNFYISFNKIPGEIHLLFEDSKVNAYTPEISFVIQQLAHFYTFFPKWLDYCLEYKFLYDYDTMEEKYKVNKNKKLRTILTFSKIQVIINDLSIGSAAILQANFDELNKAKNISNENIVNYLKKIKTDLFILNVTDYIIDCNISNIVEYNNKYKENNKYYCNKITKIINVILSFKNIKLNLEKHEILNANNFKITAYQKNESNNFNINGKKNIGIYLFDKYFFILPKISSDVIYSTKCNIDINGIKFIFLDLKFFEKNLNFIIKTVKVLSRLQLKRFDTKYVTDYSFKNTTINLNITVNNFDITIICIDPKSNKKYNKLKIIIETFLLKKEMNLLYENILNDKIEMSLLWLLFGFDPTDNNGFPMVLLPLAEININGNKKLIKINIPSKINKKLNNSWFINEVYSKDLTNFVKETQSFTVFINFKYLSTFNKIFEIFWEKTLIIRKNLYKEKNMNKSSIKNINNNEEEIINFSSKNKNYNNQDILCLSLFNLKVIYLLEYKLGHENIFRYHNNVIDQKYFGYILRLYSFQLEISEIKVESELNFLSISFLEKDNFDDNLFFNYDREIRTLNFRNLKILDNFNEFMHLDKNNKYWLINPSLIKYMNNHQLFDEEIKKTNEDETNNNQDSDLKFGSKYTIVKISNIKFINKNSKKINITIENFKLVYNKFIKDIISTLIFGDILLIVDKIILKLKINKNEEETKNDSIISHRFKIRENTIKTTIRSNTIKNNVQKKYIIDIQNPQIIIQNEIKNSTLLLMTKKTINVEIIKFKFNDAIKNFGINIIGNSLALYSYSKDKSENIYWIGLAVNNRFYLNENNFNKIIGTPKVEFQVSQEVISCDNDEFLTCTEIKVNVNQINGDFESYYFTDFINITDVLLFDRGYSFAQEKSYIDQKKKDLKEKSMNDLENNIKHSINNDRQTKLVKKISFNLNEFVFNLCENGNILIQFLLTNFDGTHDIYLDNSSDTNITIKSIYIKNIENKKDTLIFSPLYTQRRNNIQDEIDFVSFSKKDCYVSFGNKSLWYVLDLLEFTFKPVNLNITKKQIDFIVNFFFKNTNFDKEDDIKSDDKEDDNFPIYFSHFKVNSFEILLSFEVSDGNPFNIPQTKLRFNTFDKLEKFYPFNNMLQKFATHCKKQCLHNIGAIITGLFSSNSNHNNFYGNHDNVNDDKKNQNNRRILLGNK